MRFSLWHIPSSTLLVSSMTVDEIERQIASFEHLGMRLDDMMLNVEEPDGVLPTQSLGANILPTLQRFR